jgi:hypothetical protein
MKWPALRFNQLVLGFADPEAFSEYKDRGRTAHSDLLPLTLLLTSQWKEVGPMQDYWTDDRAPVEWITDRMILGFGLSGKDRGEVRLPTAP